MSNSLTSVSDADLEVVRRAQADAFASKGKPPLDYDVTYPIPNGIKRLHELIASGQGSTYNYYDRCCTIQIVESDRWSDPGLTGVDCITLFYRRIPVGPASFDDEVTE